MARTGVELKPAWRSVPMQVRQATAEVLTSPVQRAMRVWGGYTPTPTFRLRLRNGRRAFFKAVDLVSNDFARAAHLREVRVYRECMDLIAPWAPAHFGDFECAGWQVLLLQDLGPKCAPPWSPALARRVAGALADFHSSTIAHELPPWLTYTAQRTPASDRLWEWSQRPLSEHPVIALAGRHADEARMWLATAAPPLADAAQRFFEPDPPYALLHRDVRSDNLRWIGGGLRLLDWPHLGIGAPEEDAVSFAQSVAAEEGPAPEAVIDWYRARRPLRVDALTAAVAAHAGYFADQAWRPDVPGLPRLRRFQRRQFSVCTSWAARCLGLPDPTWLSGVDA